MLGIKYNQTWQMAGPPAPQPPIIPPLVPHVPPRQPPVSPTQQIVPPAQPIQPALIPKINWSHFKPECTGKLDEDEKAHLLRTNEWMDTYIFPAVSKFSDFV